LIFCGELILTQSLVFSYLFPTKILRYVLTPLRDQKQKLQLENVNHEELKKRIADMSAFLKEQPTDITEYDEQLIRRLIEKVTIYEDKFTVEFKSGLTVDINE
jgi:site-specific DNA recombinase